ncbi:MAG: translation initiation factor IF-2 [Bacteroidota bacterium]|nr:translation initiation factor IF-2 [Odoribacter sp.]MDP3642967.1 translation initiation factor IF-2 [Bacteroidota bacterium]
MVIGSIKRLSKVARDFNVGISTIVEFLHKKGFVIDTNPNNKITDDQFHLLEKEYKSDVSLKKESEKINLKSHRSVQESVSLDDVKDSSHKHVNDDYEDDEVIIKGHTSKRIEHIPQSEPKPFRHEHREEIITTNRQEIESPKVVGKIDLDHHGAVRKKEEVSAKEEKPKTVPPKPVTEEKPVPEKPKITEETKPVKEHKHEKPAAKVAPEVPEEPVREIFEEDRYGSDVLTTNVPKVEEVKVVGRIDLDLLNQKTRPAKKSKKQKEEERKDREKVRRDTFKPNENEAPPEVSPVTTAKTGPTVIKARVEKLNGPTVVGKIELQGDKKPAATQGESAQQQNRKKKRKRISKDIPGNQQRVNVAERPAVPAGERKKLVVTKNPGNVARPAGEKSSLKKRPLLKKEVSEEDVQKQIKDTLARLTTKGTKSKGSKYRKDKRQIASDRMAAQAERDTEDKNILKVTEFVSVNELATMMDASVTSVISTCMSLGLFVSINQRLDAETMAVVADEFGYKVEFVSAEIQVAIEEEPDTPEQLLPRAPIVTVMGHVDHGKTSLLDHIRSTNVIAGEAGGITQHIGAYHVKLKNGKEITFLDTPGHEAFTAMRARGAQVTDIAIIIVAADDNIMPQTVEAINHAQAAGVPIIFAINKIDKAGANPEKIKEKLAAMNFLVEDWGGKYQSQDISAKSGLNVDLLLEKILLEAEMLELKGNPNKRASGTVIESTLDKGRGYVATVLVQNGSLRAGDVLLAGQYFGHIKAMFNERNQKVTVAAPAEPVIILGLDGAPQAGDKFNVMENERDARTIANKREQLAREQGLRTQKHITLDEIGRRIAIGNFQELNLIVKGDVDGSIEALSDSLIKLSTQEIQVNVIHKAVGAISESDIMLATASNAIIVGFQVRPSVNARKIAEKEQIDIRLYSIIYDAINEIKAAMEGMLSPEIKEEITGTAEVMEAFEITKVGTIAGCIVRDGKIIRKDKVRVIRDGIVIYTGTLGSLKRFKDDVKEVLKGYECGLNIDNYNNVKEGDFIEAFTLTEVAKTL